ncbi:zinc ABC transporter substrate-binding protein [Clostridium sp. 19966]|uniref:metal ABC transporter solute-binding protein, Zn/Mn family n=1 Tax=Clostridium sp. 19966 TaxID=2768166 RepID=UPI0028E05A57|nr:zinc ABC transporter substrate-binding protein [Clostridium sp. 19966]MDT8719397.1 zinc ABC transporter substrate-binding protein [Clostridium sp. 19966]
MLKKFMSILLAGATIFALSACSKKTSESAADSSKLHVTVSFNAMRDLAEAIGKDKISVRTIIPDGTEPHDFELKPKDIASLTEAKVFIYNGLGMETWASQAVESADNKALISVEASKGVNAIKNTDESEIKDHGQYDPHAWLSISAAEKEAENIKNAFEKADSSNKDFYENNYKDFNSSLESLLNEYKGKFASVSNKNFVTGHAAFAYLCRDFGLNQASVEDVFADGEPSAKKLKELTDFCKEKGIKTVFVEDMVSPKVSQTLANEVGADVKQIATLESKDGDKTYIESMKNNLSEIYNSMSK